MSPPLKILFAGGISTPEITPETDLKRLFAEESKRSFRRTNRYIDLALAGVNRCAGGVSAGTNVYLATAQANVADTTAIMEEVIGAEQDPMPLTFINLAGNTAGYYIAQHLALDSANVTLSRSGFPFETAIQLAALDIRIGKSTTALVGGVDELIHPVSEHRRRLGLAETVQLGEGSNWIYLAGSGEGIGEIPLLKWFRNWSEMGEFAEATPWDADTALSGGNGIQIERLRLLGEKAGISRRFEYVTGAGFYQTNFAHGLVRFIERPPSTSLLHVNEDDDGQVCLVLLRMC